MTPNQSLDSLTAQVHNSIHALPPLVPYALSSLYSFPYTNLLHTVVHTIPHIILHITPCVLQPRCDQIDTFRTCCLAATSPPSGVQMQIPSRENPVPLPTPLHRAKSAPLAATHSRQA